MMFDMFSQAYVLDRYPKTYTSPPWSGSLICFFLTLTVVGGSNPYFAKMLSRESNVKSSQDSILWLWMQMIVCFGYIHVDCGVDQECYSFQWINTFHYCHIPTIVDPFGWRRLAPSTWWASSSTSSFSMTLLPVRWGTSLCTALVGCALLVRVSRVVVIFALVREDWLHVDCR